MSKVKLNISVVYLFVMLSDSEASLVSKEILPAGQDDKIIHF